MRNPLDISNIEKEVDAPTLTIKHKKQKALELSIKEGSASSFSSGLGTSYISPFILAITPKEISGLLVGLLSAFSSLTSPIAQLFGSQLMIRHSRKKIVLLFVFLESIMWLSILFIAYLFMKGVFHNYLPIALIVLYSILIAFSGASIPAWFSWMGDLVPEKDKGKYYGIRNTITGIIGLTAVLIGAFLLDSLKTRGFLLIGFMIIFALTFTFRFLGLIILKKQFSPKFKLKKSSYFSLSDFIKRFDNFGKFATYQFFFYFALMIASPFFTVYMLQDLNFSYTTFIIVSMSSSVFYLIFTPIIGKFSDRFGNLKLIYIGNILFALTPIFWIFIKSPLLLIFIPQILSGLANAAFIIGFTNFTYDSVSVQKRGIAIAYTDLFIGVGSFLGSLSGGFLIKYFPSSIVSPIIFIFILSGILRLLSGLIFLPQLKEWRRTEHLPPMKISLVHPFKSVHSEISWFRKVFR